MEGQCGSIQMCKVQVTQYKILCRAYITPVRLSKMGGRQSDLWLILMNWKERKPPCFSVDRWLEDYLDLLNMERAACLLKDFDKGLSGHWDIVRNYLDSSKICLVCFLVVMVL